MDSKKTGEPLEPERWESEIGELIHLVNLIEDELETSIKEKFLISLVLSGTALAISILTFLTL